MDKIFQVIGSNLLLTVILVLFLFLTLVITFKSRVKILFARHFDLYSKVEIVRAVKYAEGEVNLSEAGESLTQRILANLVRE